MSEKRISLSDGFEELVTTLRGLSGTCPSEAELRVASGPDTEACKPYMRTMEEVGGILSDLILELDGDLEAIESNISLAVDEQKAVDESSASDLQRILAQLEGMTADVSSETRESQVGDSKHPGGMLPQ